MIWLLTNLPEHDFTVQSQLNGFLGSILLGIPAGLLLEIFRLRRALLPGNFLTVFLEDAVYVILCAVLVQLYAAGFCGGPMRWYLICGALLGLFFWLSTAGRLFSLLYRPLRKLRSRCKKVLFRFLRRKLRFFVWNPENRKRQKKFTVPP